MSGLYFLLGLVMGAAPFVLIEWDHRKKMNRINDRSREQWDAIRAENERFWREFNAMLEGKRKQLEQMEAEKRKAAN